MRVRTLYLRLIAAVLAILWAAAVAAILIGYRPGGRLDALVAAAPAIGCCVAAVTAIWPPVARGSRIATLVGWLGVASVLLLVPTLIGTLDALGPRTPEPLLPSPETAYAWTLALAATGLFGGLGASGRILGAAAGRAARLVLGLSVSVAVTAAGLGISGIAVLGNALAFESGVAGSTASASSSWGPTDPALTPPSCTGPLKAGPDAQVTVDATARADGRVAGTVVLQGRRTGGDASWQATLTRYPAATATGSTGGSSAPASGAPDAGFSARTSHLAYVEVGGQAWLQTDGDAWQPLPADPAPSPATPASPGTSAPPPGTSASPGAMLDRAVVETALTAGRRLAAEDLGIETFGGAPARHCRLAVDGPAALDAFRPLRWLIGQAPLDSSPALAVWRGQLDWWVFADDELGMARVTIGGQPPPGWGGVLQATLTATLTARDRDVGRPIAPPGE